MSAQVLAVGNLKGGVGKTSTAVNLACDLALGTSKVLKKGVTRKIERVRGGRRVLVIDMDRQQSAGDALGVRGVESRSTYAMAIAGEEIDLNDCIHPVGFELQRGKLDVMPIAPYDYELAAASLIEYENNGIMAMPAIIEAVADDYDYIIMDLRPELSHFVSSAMAAASSGVLIPVTSEAITAVHLFEVQEHIEWVAEASGRDVKPLGVIRSRWDAKSEEARIVDEMLEMGEIPVFDTAIPAHRVVSKSFMMTTGPVVNSYPRSAATQKFQELTAEIVAAVEEA